MLSPSHERPASTHSSESSVLGNGRYDRRSSSDSNGSANTRFPRRYSGDSNSCAIRFSRKSISDCHDHRLCGTSSLMSVSSYTSTGDYLSQVSKKSSSHFRNQMRSTQSENSWCQTKAQVLSFSWIPSVSWADCQRFCKLVIEWRPLQLVMFVLIIFTLFCDDVRLALFELEDDSIFNVMTLSALGLFSTELVLTSIAVDNYFLGLFFCINMISTASLALDLTFVWDFLVGYERFNPSQVVDDRVREESGLGQFSHSGRVGTRLARILRILRLIRILRIFTSTVSPQQTQAFLTRMNISSSLSLGSSSSLDATVGACHSKSARSLGSDGDARGESRLGRELSDRTTFWVIALVLAMLVVVPVLDSGDSEDMMFASTQYGADVIDQVWQNMQHVNRTTAVTLHQRLKLEWSQQVLHYIQYHSAEVACSDALDGFCLYKLCFIGFLVDSRAAEVAPVDLNLEVSSERTFGVDEPALLFSPWLNTCGEQGVAIHGATLNGGSPCPWKTRRLQEIIWYTPFGFRSTSSGEFVFVFDIRSRVVWDAIMNMFRTVFIVLVLTIGAFCFGRDADNLVVHPIERMISTVDLIRQDPLVATRLGSERYKAQKDQDLMTQHRRTSLFTFLSEPLHSVVEQEPPSKRPTSMETRILENTILKLSSLLALGFGEAGSAIIGQNLDDDTGKVDAMIRGMKIEAIYGFCNIRNFVEISEVLQERTIVFVNLVAEIVHRIVDYHLGAPNKNVGEAFLLVWRVDCFDKHKRSKVAELSIMSLVKIVAAVHCDLRLARYLEHPALVTRFSCPRTSLGIGLHYGWAIEGAIGSEFKIDASYLSSHVNMAVRLEALTAEYGVSVLLSEPMVRLCGDVLVYYFRAIDHVKIHGCTTNTRLFALDLDCSMIPSGAAIASTDVLHQPKRRSAFLEDRLREQRERERAKRRILSEFHKTRSSFLDDISVMRSSFSLSFFQEFEKGFLNYEAGEWSVALQVLHGTLHMLETEAEDGPSRALIDYMESCNSTPPSTWSGYRHLDNERQEMCPPQQFCANVSPRHDSASYDRHYIRQFDTNTRAMPSSRNSTQNASKPNLSAESFPDDARPCVAAERRPLPHPGDRGASRDRDEELDLDLPRLLASNRLTKKI